MPLRSVVVDDEKLAREELCFLLEQAGDVEIVGQGADGAEALRLVGELRPDVVFLDVQMPGLTGFEVARRLIEADALPSLVFVTAFDQYAIDAFSVNAVDYLLKPVDSGRLEQTLERLRKRQTPELPARMPLTPDDLDKVIEAVQARQGRRDQIAIRVGERFMLIQAEEVVHASVVDETIVVVTNSVSGTSNHRTLDELQSRLDPAVFWRVHRSHLVNITKIKEIVPWFSRNFLLKMKDPKATEIPVSRSQTRRLRIPPVVDGPEGIIHEHPADRAATIAALAFERPAPASGWWPQPPQAVADGPAGVADPLTAADGAMMIASAHGRFEAPAVIEIPAEQVVIRAEPAPSSMGRVAEELFAWLKTLTSAAVYATLIVTFGFQVARVEGESMAPTLENQDRLIVNKLAYRLHDPQVGDIVMLMYPNNPDQSFVKRVIGEPGDVLRSVEGRIYRNDVPIPDDYILPEYRDTQTWGPETVKEAQYFVMGDHRNNSSDSRIWGLVPKKYITGKVQIRWWPLSHAKIF